MWIGKEKKEEYLDCSVRGLRLKFFAGLIFVVTLLGPVVSLLAGQDWEEEILRTVTESWPEYREDGRAPDFDRISETGAEIYERHAAEMAEDLADE